MLRLGAVVMKVSDVDRAGAFWSAALGYSRQPNNLAFLVPEGTPGTRLHLDDEDRTHLDLWADGEADQQAEVVPPLIVMSVATFSLCGRRSSRTLLWLRLSPCLVVRF
jgi:catechol 2,3-dioxygenase-like lactoylglutathione lyase family enzyme